MGKYRIAVYTALIGQYDELRDPLVVEDFDYYCFTDQNITSRIGKIVKISESNFPQSLTDVKKSRYIKTHPHILLKDYDKTIYIDANLIIKNSLKELVDDSSFKLFKHPFRDCIYDEAAALSQGNIDTEAINRGICVLRDDNYPRHNGLTENNFIIRDNSCESIDLNEKGGDIICQYSYRDQMSLCYIIGKYKFNVNISDIVIRNSKYIDLVNHKGR